MDRLHQQHAHRPGAGATCAAGDRATYHGEDDEGDNHDDRGDVAEHSNLVRVVCFGYICNSTRLPHALTSHTHRSVSAMMMASSR